MFKLRNNMKVSIYMKTRKKKKYSQYSSGDFYVLVSVIERNETML